MKISRKSASAILLALCCSFQNTYADVAPTQRNYVMRARPGVSITDSVLSESQLYDGRTQISLSYFDGLGRSIGQCEMGAGGAGEDIFTLVEYDRRGLEARRWQPVPIELSQGMLPGAEAFAAEAADFYGDTRAYTETVYEETALRRPSWVTAPGQVTAGHQTEIRYGYNDAAGALSLARYEFSGSLVRNIGMYPANSLRVTESIDPDGRRVIEFEDCEGVPLCRRVITDEGTYADTRRVYDRYGDLRVVLQPELANSIGTEMSVNRAEMKRYAWYYTYDWRHRVTRYRAPGRETAYNVYDALGRLVLTQTGEQHAAHQWTYLMYDANHRKAVQGVLTTTTSQTRLAAMLDTVMITARRDDTRYTDLYYDCADAPGTFEPYQSWLYDDYGFMEWATLPEAPAAAEAVEMAGGRGLQTGMAYKVDGTVYVRAAGYDSKARPVTSVEYDSFGQSYRLCLFTRYDFCGNVVWQCERYDNMAEQTVIDSRQVALRHTLDRAGRVVRTDFNTSADISPSKWTVLRRYTYDGLGRLSEVTDGVTAAYAYDVRSRMTSVSSPLFSQQLFYGASPLNAAHADYSGNIVASVTRPGPGAAADTLCYVYDRMGRMTSATGTRLSETLDFDLNGNVRRVDRSWRGTAVSETHVTLDGNLVSDVTEYAEDVLSGTVPRISRGDYPAAMAYDRDGRLVSDSTRHIARIDYEAFGAALPRFIDMGTNSIMLRYRPDGTLAQRRHTRRYTELFTDRKGVTRERVRTDETRHTFAGSFESVSGQGWIYHFDGGFLTMTDGTPHYFARDYQGSTRAVYTASASQIAPLAASAGDMTATPQPPYTVEQVTDYYPTGLPVDITAAVTGLPAASAATDRLHIGNRWINHAGVGYYDNTARYFDVLTVRFTAADQLEWKYYSLSPWAHCAGNPVNFIDPSGMIFTADSEKDIDDFINITTDRLTAEYTSVIRILFKGGGLTNKNYRKISQHIATANKYNEVLSEIKVLRNSDVVYNIVHTRHRPSGNEYADGGTRFNFETKQIDLELYVDPENKNNLAHELKHAYQFETGKLSLRINGTTPELYDQTDEEEAYERGQLYDGPSWGWKGIHYTKFPSKNKDVYIEAQKEDGILKLIGTDVFKYNGRYYGPKQNINKSK